MNTAKPEYMNLSQKLRKMKLSGMADELDRQAMDPNIDLRDVDERITELIEAEWDLRYNKKLNRFLKKACLRYPTATLDETIYDADRKLDHQSIEQLATCEWIDHRRNLLITGKSSTGKSYMANALGVCAIKQFRSVKYVKTHHDTEEQGPSGFLSNNCMIDISINISNYT